MRLKPRPARYAMCLDAIGPGRLDDRWRRRGLRSQAHCKMQEAPISLYERDFFAWTNENAPSSPSVYAARPATWTDSARSGRICAPPRPEQERIVHRLREQLAAAESARLAAEAQLKEIQRLPDRILATAFGDGERGT